MTTPYSALVVGGTGPTGPPIVTGLLDRGFDVTIMHTGAHEVDEIDDLVRHIHTDVRDGEAMAAALGAATFDVAVVTYGRLRTIAQLLAGRVDRFVSVGGGPAYLGYMNPEALSPAGMPVPVREDAPKVTDPAHDHKGYRIEATEREVLAHQPDAIHFRYPFVYGPRQLVPREWCIVRRILDGRRHIIVPDGGLTLASFGYVDNLAHAVLLAVDAAPGPATGRIYNIADVTTPTLRQVVEVTAAALDHEWEIVSMPWELAVPARPLMMQRLTTHRVYDLTAARTLLGYDEVVHPFEALGRTAQWLATHRPEPGGFEEQVLEDPFDYGNEDRLIDRYRAAVATVEQPSWPVPPGYGMAYTGPGGRPSSVS